MDEGAGPYDSTGFQEKLEELAVELRFDASRDIVSGSLKTLTRNRDAAVELLRLSLNEPRLAEEAIERVKAQIAARLRREMKDPDAIAGRTFSETAFAGHPYGRPVAGTLETLPAITRQDLVDIHARIFARDRLKIAVVGAIDAATLKAALDKAFGALPEKARLVPVPEIAPAGLGQTKVIDLDVPQAVIRMGRPGLKRMDPDFIPAFVLNHILGGGTFTSRLFVEVREKRGLAYSVWSGLTPLDRAALFSAGTSTQNARAGESIAVINAEVARIIRDGVTAEELDKAKKYLTGSFALRFDSSTKIAGELLQLQLFGLGIDHLDKRNAQIEAVTLEDLKRAADRLLGDGTMLTVVVGRPVGL
jgi:zinc protease